MKRRVIVEKDRDRIHVYLLIIGMGRYYMFTVRYSKGVYEYFANAGRSESEILAFDKWGRNPRLDKLITRLPPQIRWTVREVAE